MGVKKIPSVKNRVRSHVSPVWPLLCLFDVCSADLARAICCSSARLDSDHQQEKKKAGIGILLLKGFLA
jgi:hypothetical protein